ncbi:MAG: nucleotidyltransferase family protein [Bacteroidota bacterium]
MIKEAIVLAGGLGTRLRSVVSEQPKSMAPINGRPFLEYQLDGLLAQGIERIIFSVGYKSDYIINHFKDGYKGAEVVFALERAPLGTGGAIKNAMQAVQSEHVLVVNGDSLFLVDIQAEYQLFLAKEAHLVLALKPMQDFERYGSVLLDEDDRINAFLEKRPVVEGLINGGVYIFDKTHFDQHTFPQKFSIERDYFEAMVAQEKMYGFISDQYFLDIGIPEDFAKAQVEFGRLNLG